MSKQFHILSIDGGGIRGVFPAHLLQCTEERLKINLLENVDMITGTSTGSIIAAGIAAKIPVSQISKMYIDHGKNIFKKKKFMFPGRNLKNMVQPMLQSVYSSDYLKEVLSEVFQELTLGDIHKPLLLPATDVGNGCVHVLKSAYSKEFTRDNPVLVKDAVLASCSAPTYFDPHSISPYLLADGGLWANNPALAAVIDAQKRLGINIEDIRILSIGTGSSKTMYGTNPARKWGLINGWRHKDFIGFIFSLQSQSALNYLKLMLQPNQIIRIDFESDMPLPLDDISIIADLKSRADHSFTHESEQIRRFFNA